MTIPDHAQSRNHKQSATAAQQQDKPQKTRRARQALDPRDNHKPPDSPERATPRPIRIPPPHKTDKRATKDNPMSKAETTSKGPLQPTSRINPARQGKRPISLLFFIFLLFFMVVRWLIFVFCFCFLVSWQ